MSREVLSEDPSCNILLVEDCPDSQEIFSHVLKKIGAKVTHAANGKECVDIALKALDNNSAFDVILMDLQMPIMDGHSAARTLRQKGYKLPILAMTARSGPDDSNASMVAGCDGHISKLAGMNSLISEVKKQIYKSKTVEVEMPVLPLVPQFLRDNPSYAEFALHAIESIGSNLEKLNQFVKDSNFEGIKLLGNQLGKLSLYGYSHFSNLANDIQLAAEKKEKAQIDHKVEQICRSFKAIVAGVPQLKKMTSHS